MNLKELIKFGLENSSDPVIKNPILRQALEPRSMDLADGGRIGFSEKPGAVTANVIRQKEAIKNLNDKWTDVKVKEAAEILYPDQDINKILRDAQKRRKINKHLTDYGEGLPEEKARKKGRIKRDITLNLVNKDKTVNIDAVRENLIKNKKKVTMVNNQFIFADEKLQQEFLDDMILRYKYPKTSTAAKNAGVKSNAQIFETYFKGTYSEKGVHDLINRFKKTLGETFSKLPPRERDAHKLRREAKLLISQAGKRISGLDEFPSHHLFPIGDEFAHGTQDFTIIDKQMNSQLSGPNKQLVALTEQRSDLINDVNIGKINPKEFDIEMDKLDTKAQKIIDGHYKNFPNHDGLLNWRKASSVLDDQGRFMDIQSTGTIGGDYSKWSVTDINKKIGDLSKTELATFRGDIKNIAEKKQKKTKANILNGFCGSKRKKFATAGVVDGLVCSMEEIQENIKKQTNQAMKATKDGKIPKQFGKLKGLAKFFGWIDAPIEFMFAAPHLIAGDIEGAKRATTAGIFGWGEVDLDKISDKEAQRYLKHTKAMNNYFDNYGTAITTEKALENLTPGTGAHDLMNNQFETAKANMDKIQEDYQSYGYTYQEGDTPLQGKVATQKYIRDKVKSDFEKKIDKQATTEAFKDADQELLKEQLRDLGGRPEKVTPITDLESYMRNKGEEMAGNTNLFFNVKPYVLEEAEALGVGDIFDDYALGAGVEGYGRKSLQDAYSEIPIEYANQLAALEKKQLEEGLLEKRLTGFAGGGIAGIRRPNAIPPESGPNPQGLPSMYNRVKRI